MAPKSKPLFASNNFRAVLNPDNYDDDLKIMAVILRASDLHQPLSRFTHTIPIRCILNAYETSTYVEEDDHITVVLTNNEEVILDRNLFVRSLGIKEVFITQDDGTKVLENPYDELATDEELVEWMKEIGFADDNPGLGDIKKVKFPHKWHFAVHLVIRCIAGKSGGFDAIVRDHLRLLHALYRGKHVDVGSVVWDDFASFVNNKKPEIPHARYWSLCLKHLYAKFPTVTFAEDDEKFHPKEISSHIRNKRCPADSRRLPQAMLSLVGLDHELVKDYIEKSKSLPQAADVQSASAPSSRPSASSPKKKKSAPRKSASAPKPSAISKKSASARTISAPDQPSASAKTTQSSKRKTVHFSLPTTTQSQGNPFTAQIWLHC